MTYQAEAPSTYYAGDGTHALLELKSKCEALFLGWLAYRAGKNYYEVNPDVTEAFIRGAHALRRWFFWLFFFKVWLFSIGFLGWMLYLRFHDVRGESFQPNSHDFNNVTITGLVLILPATAAVLVAYCRNVDYSLFKRRFVYRVAQPLVKAVDRLPQWSLYLTVACVLCFPTGWFHGGGEAAPVREDHQTAFNEVCREITDARSNGSTTVEINDRLADNVGLGSNVQEWYTTNC